MDKQEQAGLSADLKDDKSIILEIDDETPDFSEDRENAGGFSDVPAAIDEDDSLFEFEITEDFWQQAEAFQTNPEPSEAPATVDLDIAEFLEPAPDLPEQPDEPLGDFRVLPKTEAFFDFPKEPEPEAPEEDAGEIYLPPQAPKRMGRRVLRSIASWSLTIVIAFILALLINIFVFRPSEVSGESMVPTLHNTDTVILSKIPYVFGEPDRGDIVVIDSHVNEKRSFFTLFEEALKYNIITKLCGQEEPDYFWIKRVVGVAGDEISFFDNHIYRNGELLQEDYINENFIYTYPNGISVTVPEGCVYVMGDNRNHSTDSRAIGVVPLENIIGKMIASW